MTTEEARAVARILGGEPHEREADKWVVLITRADGRVVAISAQTVDEYSDLDDFEAGRCYDAIALT